MEGERYCITWEFNICVCIIQLKVTMFVLRTGIGVLDAYNMVKIIFNKR
jgi:hypothetical protein